MIANYHTHTRWCRHGGGEIEDYILEGIAKGLEELAITEHVPLPGDPDPFRLRRAEFEAFNDELNRMIAKYAGQIRVLKGFECEYYPNLLARYKRFREEYGYQILLLGHHTNCANTVDNFLLTEPSQLRRYADEVCEGLETGLFDILAHPDVVMAGYQRYDTALCEAMKRIFATCERLDIPVEINANGHHYRRGYPCPMVWENLAPQYKLRCVVCADAHEVENLAHPSVQACERMVKAAGLQLVERLALDR